MIQTNITARLECTRKELLHNLVLTGIEVHSDGKVVHGKTGKLVTVKGNPFIFVNKTNKQMVEVIYAGHKLEVLWYRIRPIGGETR